MLAMPRMARDVRPRRVIRAKSWAVRNYAPSMLAHPLQALAFVLLDPELDNYTYDLANLDELCDFFVSTLGLAHDTVARYIRELEDDSAFRSELSATLRSRTDRKPVAMYGRRVGWYCLIRSLRPRVIVETGVHDGLGSSVLLQAVQRNRTDGYEGHVIGIDINPKAGWLIPQRLRDHLTLVIEDSALAVPRIAREYAIDLFIHDSDHRYSHELKEFQQAAHGLASGAVVLSDNSHVTTALQDFSAASGRRYAFWKERPKHHFYPGSGIGLSVA